MTTSRPAPMTSSERVRAALSLEEPDRVPLLLFLSLHGSRELGLGLREYFSRPENVAEAQLRLRARFGHDCLDAFFYASLELEAFGGETLFSDDGPPNAGAPIIRSFEDILRLEPPRVRDSRPLQKVLRAIELMRERDPSTPIIGVVVAPSSLPVVQLGFAAYLDLMIDRPDLHDRLMRVNEAFCVEWANAQLAAGATALAYFDPVSSATIMPPEHSARTGLAVARRAIAQIRGPVVMALAAARCLPIANELTSLGAVAVCVGHQEDLGEIKSALGRKVAVIGNLNGVEMRRWTPERAEAAVRDAIAAAGRGGGFVLADGHGEIPLQVSSETLEAICRAVDRWGRYPLDWTTR